MKTKTIPVISMVSLDFDSIEKMSDKEVVEHLLHVCRSSRKRLIPAKVRYNKCRVSRATDRVTVHLLADNAETCRVNFVPGPSFR